MKNLLCWILLAAILVDRGFSVPTVTEPTDDDDDSDWEDEDDSSEADDDGRVYKNPRNSPSTECPRNEEQATLLGQKCLRKCSSDEDCKSKKKKCLCDGVCGMSCIKPDRECPDIPEQALGAVTISSRFFGGRADYSCQHGYHVVGLQSRLCQADGHWAGQEPACKQNIYCLTPPTIEHAIHSALPEQATFDLDATVQYTCEKGYDTNGFPRAKCLAIDGRASWYGPDVVCEPRSCGQPTDPAHGWHAGECYSFNCRITYHCGEGYELVGKQERFCQTEGAWAPKELPTCVLVTAVQCPPPENPKNGKAIYTSCSYNSVVSYECRYGYTLVGESSRRCGADRRWSGSLPACKEINCGHPGVLYNGWLENIESGTGLGASIIFRCHAGMLLEGHTSTVCQIDGRWRYAVPQCLAPCVVPTILQGTVLPIDVEVDINGTTTLATPGAPTTSKVKHGTTLDVVCDEHYEFPLSSLSPPTCNNGTWSVIPRCVPARCKTMPKYPKNGMVLAPKTEHGMKARFKCKDGFKLTGPGGKNITDQNEYVMTCSFGNWSGETPECLEVYCAFPGYIPHGKVLLVGNMGLYDYRPYVKKVINNKQIMYECDKGYVVKAGSPPGATCVGGSWSPIELPTCILGQHPRLRWNRRRRSAQLHQKRFSRSDYLQRFYRSLSRQFYNPHRDRTKRLTTFNNPILRFETLDLSNALRRQRRELSEVEQAYTQYYEKIKQKYRKYVKNLLNVNRQRFTGPHHIVEDDVHQGHEAVHKYRDIHQTRMNANNRDDATPFLGQSSKLQTAVATPISIPNINDNIKPVSDDNEYTNIREKYVNNDFDVMNNFWVDRSSGGYDSSQDHKKENVSSIIAQLKSQIVRRKRSDDDGRRNHKQNRRQNQTAVEEWPDNPDAPKRGKPKGPCEPIIIESTMNIEVIRPGRDLTEEYSSGTMVKVTCGKGYNLNLVNPNGTAKCVRGRWKPMTPMCLMQPCTVPATEHGTYFLLFSDTATSDSKPNPIALSYPEEIENGQVMSFKCRDGYNTQGPSNLRCHLGELAVNSLPECLPSPCLLPRIANAAYQGGYRAGLTIAHGSSVTIVCDNAANTAPVQMDCQLGSLSPQTVSCGLYSRKSREDLSDDSESSEHTHLAPISEVNHDGRDCGSPHRDQGSLVYSKNGEPLDEGEEGFPSGTEVLFNCIASSAGERSTWKITCEDGFWVGRSFSCANGTCLFANNEPHIVSFYNDLEIREEIVEFPPGATIVSRCVDIGKFHMVGSSVRTCIHSEWNGNKPTCFGLNQENDYAMEKPPTVLFRHQNGPIAQSNDGKLIVYPGTTIHMECLWMRRFGNPKWNVSHDYRKYPEGWAEEDGRDSGLEYRLSVIHAVEDDSGIFSCQTPARHEHSVEVVVKAINCPEIPPRRGLTVSSRDSKMTTKVILSCHNGNALIGASEITCLPSGNWSAPLPVCESVECGEISLPPNNGNGSVPRVSILSREVGGRAAFSCITGFGLRGSTESVCLPTGEWSTPFPTCAEVTCDNPGAPQNGYAQGSPPYRASDVVQFNCNPEYMMQGQPIIACQDNGRWSGGLPKCVQACSYPGTAISGRMSSVKFYYTIGESITFTCDAGLELRGAKMLKCLRNGKWSNAIPTCINQDTINERSSNKDLFKR